MASRIKHFTHSIRNRTTHRPPPDSGPPMPSHTPVPVSAPVPNTSMKESAKLAWHAFKMVSKNIEKFLDGTPFKLPFGIINTLIGIADAIIMNRESMAILLLPIGQRLEIVSSGLARKGRPRGIESSCERFSRVLFEGVDELVRMRSEGILKRLVKSNEHPQQLEDIFRRIDEATKNFELELTLAIFREVDGITQHAEILRLRDLRPSREARYTEVKRDGCVEGTRKEIIQDIMTWCMDDSSDCPPIYWLSGMAGTGKSTIAYTICDKLHDHGDASRRLGASFFCSRQLEGARLRQNVIPTIAHDLAHSFPDFGRALLASKFDVICPPLKDHIRSLLSGPWRSVAANLSLPPLVVVIDALDELDGVGQGSQFLEQLIMEIAQYPGGFRGLKFFVTSRQDPRIVDVCACLDSRAVCRLEEVPSKIIENDIHLYLCTTLPALDQSTLRTLAKHASGLFIYAATAVRFIVPPSQHEEPTLRMQTERLDLLLRAWPDKSVCGVDGLLVDHLYEEVLSLWLSPKSKVQQRIARAVLQTVICTEEPIFVTDIPRFLEPEFDVEEEEALNLILSLHAILHVFENRAYSYHKSFIDFMTNTTRFASQELATLLCPTLERQLCLATSCFRVMYFLRFNICELSSSYLDDFEVEDLQECIERNISHALRYACRNWAKHMSKTEPSHQWDVKDMLALHQKWMDSQFLFWVEVMNLLKVVRECYPLLVTARQWLEKNITLELEQKNNLMAAENFVTSFGSTAMTASTPHLYVSALATCNWESPLISRWRDRFPRIPTVTAILNEDLPLASLSLTNDCSSSHNWLFLPDGIHIAGSILGSYFLWDTSTGQLEKIASVPFVATSKASYCFSVSPDGKHVAGTTGDIVWIWEVPTGNEVHQLEGYTGVDAIIFSRDGTCIMITDLHGVHVRDTSTWNELCSHWLDRKSRMIKSACFSPDGRFIASGSGGTVYIWDVSNGNELYRLNAKCEHIFSVDFSPDGTRVLSGSKHPVQIWDLSNGNELYRFIEQDLRSVYFSPDGTYIASSSHNGVQIWDASNGNELYRLGKENLLPEACFSPDGTQFLSMTNTTIHIWDLSSGKELCRLVEQGGIESVCFSPDGTRILSTRFNHLMLWDVPTTKAGRWHQPAGLSAEVLSTRFSPDGKQIVTLSHDGTLCILDATTLIETERLMTGRSGAETHFTVDGTHIICFEENCGQCDVLTGALLKANKTYAEDAEHFDCTRSGTLHANHTGGSLKFRNVSAGGGEPWVVNGFTYSPDGSRLATGLINTTVSIWDTSTGKQLKELVAHNGTVKSVCFSPNGKQIVSGSDDTTVRIWDVPGMQECQCSGTNSSIGVLPGEVRKDACPSYHSRAATWTFLDSDTIHRDWCVDSDGWVKSSKGEQYFWLSKKMHAYLNRPDSVAISARGSVEIDFTTGRFGERWADCYEPGEL